MAKSPYRPRRDVAGRIKTAGGYALASLLVAVVLGFAAAVAHADAKVYPGTSCQVWGGHKDFAEYISYSQFGAIMNTHPTKRLGVVCPLMRDRPDRLMDLAVYWTDAYMADDGAKSELRCRFRSNNIWGIPSNISSSVGSDNWGDAFIDQNEQGYGTVQRGRFWWNNLNGQQSNGAFDHDTSTYTVYCLLPPTYDGKHSSIGSFVTEED